MNKRTGVVVDYFGVFANLGKALNFDENIREEALIDWDALKATVPGEVGRCMESFPGLRISDTRECLLAALQGLKDPDAAKTLLADRAESLPIIGASAAVACRQRQEAQLGFEVVVLNDPLARTIAFHNTRFYYSFTTVNRFHQKTDSRTMWTEEPQVLQNTRENLVPGGGVEPPRY